MDPVREQYEKHPYPPVSPLALPHPRQGEALRYELGMRLATQGEIASHAGKRILVAGAGTIEALVVAENHPLAREIVAVDISEASLNQLKIRTSLARFRNFLQYPIRQKKLPPLNTVRADLMKWEGGKFDFILASHVLHHVQNPAELLKRLANWLSPDGILRISTYPKASRIWMRQTSQWLKLNGLTAKSRGLLRKAKKLIQILPHGHPIRSCFLSHPEIGTKAGLIDAFFHAYENPLSPLEWKTACEGAGLRLVAEAQAETSRSQFLEELVPATRALDCWSKLQILDDLLELCSNPVFWLVKEKGGTLPHFSFSENKRTSMEVKSSVYLEMAQGLRRAQSLLQIINLSLEEVISILKEKVGPRVTPPPQEEVLPGLSITEYDIQQILEIS